MAYLQLWIDKTVRPIWEAHFDRQGLRIKNILSKPFINMNRLLQTIIALAWNEDTMILLKKYFTLKLNLISRMVFGSQVPYATRLVALVVITLPFFQRYFHFVRRYRNHCGTEMIGNMGTKIPLNNHFRFWIIDLRLFDMLKRGKQFKIIIWIKLREQQKSSLTNSFSRQTIVVIQINLYAPMSLIFMGPISTIFKDLASNPGLLTRDSKPAAPSEILKSHKWYTQMG